MQRRSLIDFLLRHDTTLQTAFRIGFAVCILTVSVLSLLPGDRLPKPVMSDKLEHFIAYWAIALSGTLGFRARNAYVLVIAGAIALGGAIEIGQLYVPGRSAEILDFAVNILGVAAGAAFSRPIIKALARRGASRPLSD